MKRLTLTLMAYLAALSMMAQGAWRIIAKDINPSNYYGETVANGMLGLVSSAEPLKTSNTVLAESYDKFGRGEVSNFLPGFNFLNVDLYVDGTKIGTENITGYSQCLNMYEATFSGEFTFMNKASVRYQMASLRQLPFCALMTVDVTPLKDITIKVRNNQALPEGYKNPKMRYEAFKGGHGFFRLLSTEASSPTGKLTIAACSEFLFPQNVKIPEITSEKNDSDIWQQFTVSLKKGKTYRFAVIGSTMSTAHHPDPINEVKRLTEMNYLDCERAPETETVGEILLNKHKAQWAGLWKSDIIIDGDEKAQLDVHSMMYHLYAFLRDGSRMSISPMGLSGNGYNGHIFWDADTWMYPALLLLHPELAKSMIDYRYDRLPAARRYALEHGYKGAMFPWESADSGFEDTPVIALTGPYEHHITGCVAFAAWQYYCVTGDKEYLRTEGWPLISETANYWLSRVEAGKDGFYHINNVVAADEWAENIDDNAFTNGAAKMNLLCATKAAKVLGFQPNPEWMEVAEKLKFFEKDGVTMEYATYNGENIKQADVNLLAFPLKLITDRKRIESDLEYYSKRVPNEETPAMTQAMFTLLYARLGNAEKAWHYFNDAYKPNQLPPFGVIAECKGGTNPYFITGAGGILQSMLMGFGGIDISYDGEGIRQVPSVLPKSWNKLTLKGIGPDRKTFVVENKE